MSTIIFNHHNSLTINNLHQAGAAPRKSLQRNDLRVGTINALRRYWLRGYPKVRQRHYLLDYS